MYTLCTEGRSLPSESVEQGDKLTMFKQKLLKKENLANAIALEDGLVYIGEMENGERHGFGILIYPNGSILEGMVGRGILLDFQRSKIIIISIFNRIYSLYELYISYFCFQIDYNWINGRAHGICRLQYSEDEYYQGSIVNNRFQGYGEYVNHSTSIYKGQWENNEKHGYGEEYFKNGSIYCGNFIRGMREGEGVYLSSNGSKYQGQFKCNRMDGDGMMLWRDGSFYQGEFSNNEINGYGVYMVDERRKFNNTYPDGSQYQGQFLNGKRNGHGCLIRYDGYEVSGEWKGDKFYKN